MADDGAAPRCPTCGRAVPPDAPAVGCPHCMLRLADTLLDEPVGQLSMPAQIGGHEIVRELGRGGMGVVYLARQANMGRLVALKVIRHGEFAEPAAVEMFRREVAILARLEHDNIVPIHDASGLRDDPPFFVMQWIDGGTLADPLIARNYHDPPAATELLVTIAKAVQSAHERSVLHRDLKPANILIDRHGRPHVSDFSVAKLIEGDAPALGHTIAGTLGF